MWLIARDRGRLIFSRRAKTNNKVRLNRVVVARVRILVIAFKRFQKSFLTR
jgi:hypothetical protein